MMSEGPPPKIFNDSARIHKRRRAQNTFEDHDFIHQRAADDIVERLETILKKFEHALFYGPGSQLVADRLTQAADVAQFVLADVLEVSDQIACSSTKIPFADQQFDLVVSFMALHMENDFPNAMLEARRVLKPDGLFLAIFPGERTLFELRDCLQIAESEVTGKVSSRVIPFVAVKDGGALLQRAGFALPVADKISLPIEYQNPGRLFQDLRGMGETSTLALGPKGAFRRDVLTRTIDAYRERYPSEDDGISATVELVCLTGWAPHQSQPKPLKPGSGKASLEKAILDQIDKKAN